MTDEPRPYIVLPPDQPDYEDIMVESDLEPGADWDVARARQAALPSRFHTPAWMDADQGAEWVCRVCWGDGWVMSWPCDTARRGDVFGDPPPDHRPQPHDWVYRVGSHNPRNIYRYRPDRPDDEFKRDEHIACAFDPAHGPFLVRALNGVAAVEAARDAVWQRRYDDLRAELHRHLAAMERQRDEALARVAEWEAAGR